MKAATYSKRCTTIYPTTVRHIPVDLCRDREVIFIRPVAPVVGPLRTRTWRSSSGHHMSVHKSNPTLKSKCEQWYKQRWRQDSLLIT